MPKPKELLRPHWSAIDSAEMRILLDKRFGGPGQYLNLAKNPNRLHLPLADESCRVSLTFKNGRIVSITPGMAFDEDEWQQISDEIERSVIDGPVKVGREFSFSSLRVLGSWRGSRSSVQILPPPNDAPSASVEMAEHPFILEFPVRESGLRPVTNFRRMREHRRLTLLLNILLAARICYEPPRPEHCWVEVRHTDGRSEFKWAQRRFSAKLGSAVADGLSSPSAEPLEVIEANTYPSAFG